MDVKKGSEKGGIRDEGSRQPTVGGLLEGRGVYLLSDLVTDPRDGPTGGGHHKFLLLLRGIVLVEGGVATVFGQLPPRRLSSRHGPDCRYFTRNSPLPSRFKADNFEIMSPEFSQKEKQGGLNRAIMGGWQDSQVGEDPTEAGGRETGARNEIGERLTGGKITPC